MKNEYIYERKGKNGLTLQIKVPERKKSGRTFRSASVKVYEFPSKAAAYEHARMLREQMMIDIRNNTPVRKSPTVKKLYEDYWEISPYTLSTKKQYDSIYPAVIKPLENLHVTDVEAADIQKTITAFAEDHSARLIGQAKTMWHRIFITAQMQGINVSDKTIMLLPIHTRHVSKPKKHANVTVQDFVAFTAALLDRDKRSPKTNKIDKDVWYMLWIMYYTGCRPAEVLALCRDDIDLVSNVIRISKSIGSKKGSRRQIVDTKRVSSRREIPICDELKLILTDLCMSSNTSPLICCEDGLPYDIRDIVDRITVNRRRTGIPFNSYQLRHMFSDDMFDRNVSPVVIRDLMGHKSSTMSLEYAKATKGQMQDAIDSREQIGNKTLA